MAGTSNGSTGGSGPTAGTGGMGGTSSGGTGGSGPTAGGTGGAAGASGTGVVADQVLCGDVQLTASLIIAAGKTVTICAGSVVTAASKVNVTVGGTLKVLGTQASPVKFVGTAHTPGYWGGIALDAGGSLMVTFAEVHDAAFGLNARVGSTFQIDHILVDNSNQLLLLAANGTLSHGVLHGLLANQSFSPVVISDASPTLVDTVVNQGLYGGVDLIIVTGATAAPVFDHMEVADSHCGFHFNQGAGVIVRNSFVHHNSYGVMVNGATTQFVHNNFQDNAPVNIGSCSGVPGQVTDNYFVGPPVDDSCLGLTVTGSVASAYTTDVGPRP